MWMCVSVGFNIIIRLDPNILDSASSKTFDDRIYIDTQRIQYARGQ